MIVHLVLLILFSAWPAPRPTYLIRPRMPRCSYLIASGLGIVEFLQAEAATLASDGGATRSSRSTDDLIALAREPKRLALIVLGCAGRRSGTLALWASIETFGGGTTFVTVTVVTMMVGAFSPPPPTQAGLARRVEAALISGIAPSVYLQHWVCRRCCCIDY